MCTVDVKIILKSVKVEHWLPLWERAALSANLSNLYICKLIIWKVNGTPQ